MPWLAPAGASVLLFALSFTLRTGEWHWEGTAPEPMMAMTLSNQSVAAYLPGSFRGQRNRLAADDVAERFGSTRPGGSSSSMASFVQWMTNSSGR